MATLFMIPKKLRIVIYIIVIAFLAFIAWDSRADEPIASFTGGYAALRGGTPAIGINVRWPESGPGTSDWEIGLLRTGSSAHYRDNRPVSTVYGMLVGHAGMFDLGLGLAHHESDPTWEYTCADTYVLAAGLRWQWLRARWYHFSSGGSCIPNAGRDIPMLQLDLTWRF